MWFSASRYTLQMVVLAFGSSTTSGVLEVQRCHHHGKNPRSRGSFSSIWPPKIPKTLTLKDINSITLPEININYHLKFRNAFFKLYRFLLGNFFLSQVLFLAGDVSGFQKISCQGIKELIKAAMKQAESVESFLTEKHGNKTAVLMITVCVEWLEMKFFVDVQLVDVIVFLFWYFVWCVLCDMVFFQCTFLN